MWRKSLLIAATLALSLTNNVGAAMDLDDVQLPPGFSIEIYAEVNNARSLALGSNGVVFVSNRRSDSVYAIVPREGRAIT